VQANHHTEDEASAKSIQQQQHTKKALGTGTHGSNDHYLVATPMPQVHQKNQKRSRSVKT